MLDRLAVRIGVAFVAVGLATTLAVGAGLLVTLREMHREATQAAMADVAQPLVARFRLASGAVELRRRLNGLAEDLPDGVDAFLLTANGRVIGSPPGDADAAAIEIDPGLGPGEVAAGSLAAADGTPLLYAATVISRTAAGANAIVLATTDRSTGAAWRDLTRVLPLVVLVALLVGVPIAWLLSRSITRPLRRLAAATADVPSSGAEPLPLEGPREVRDRAHVV